MRVVPIKEVIQNPKKPALEKKQSQPVYISIKDHNDVKVQVESNRPKDPVVAKKVLDSLSTGMISFSQKERDTIASILNSPTLRQ